MRKPLLRIEGFFVMAMVAGDGDLGEGRVARERPEC